MSETRTLLCGCVYELDGLDYIALVEPCALHAARATPRDTDAPPSGPQP